MSLADNAEKGKLARLWQGHSDELWIILVAMLGLGLVLGLWQWHLAAQPPAPLTIENIPIETENIATVSAAKSSEPSPAGEPASAKAPAAKGKFLASKNGTRYYLPTCAGAKRIKEENKVWFATVEEARAKGLTPAANCPGL